MKSYNKEISKAFNEIADLLGIIGEGFFITRAYREAARYFTEESDSITSQITKKDLLEMPRIGQALANKALEYIKTGQIQYLEELRIRVPKSVRDLLQIPNLGPSRIGKLFFLADIKSKKELIKAAKGDELIALPGFGKKTVDKIMEAISSDQQKKKRHNRSELRPIANNLLKLIKSIKGVNNVEICGSYRREAKTSGDLDILILGTGAVISSVESKVLKSFPNNRLIASGNTKISFVIFPNNLQIDLRFVPKDSWGAALLYFTGSKDYNIMMRRVAIEKGYLLSEYGLFKDGEYIAGKTEKEVCKKLDLPYVEPKRRR